MALNMNSSVDQNSPNQASPGAPFPAAATGTTLITRKGVTTMITTPAALTASIVLQFDTVANQGWKNGDIVFVSVPSHTGGGFTITVESIADVVLATWAALLSAGGMFYFNGVDFQSVIAGASTT